jgi:hypothetical protein
MVPWERLLGKPVRYHVILSEGLRYDDVNINYHTRISLPDIFINFREFVRESLTKYLCRIFKMRESLKC